MTSRKAAKPSSGAQTAHVVRTAPNIYAIHGEGFLSDLRKSLLATDATSRQGTDSGLKTRLFSLTAVRDFSAFNPHHSACIGAKVNATVGLGFKSEEVENVLDPVCETSAMDLMLNFARDYWEAGEGLIEVVRSPSDPDTITGLHHLAPADCEVFVENANDPSKWHWRVNGEEGSVEKRFARFGDLEDYLKRNNVPAAEAATVSEVIHWRMPTSLSRWYGHPEYFSCVPSIELVQAMTQHEFNFFFNNGVPEYLLFIIGKKIDTPSWNKITTMLKANQGVKNTRRSQAINITAGKDEVEVQVEKLGASTDAASSPFAPHSEVAAANIVTAHGVPPILAGIQLPGKMAASNEGPNALMLFQVLKIGPAQRALSRLLASTLGKDGLSFRTEEGGVEKLTRDDFLGTEADEADNTLEDPDTGRKIPGPMKSPIKGNGFNTVVDQINLGALDTMSRMREPVTGSGRDLNAGPLGSSDDRKKAGGKPTRGTGAAKKRPSRR